MDCSSVMAVRISKRKEEAVAVQNILTKHGCIINLRVGLHETTNQCSDEGLIILHLCGEEDEIAALKTELSNTPATKVYTMDLK